MKKIAIILSVLFVACVATSCVKPFEPTIELSLNNYNLTLPKNTTDSSISGNTHVIEIRSLGPWEATLEILDSDGYGLVWAWLEPFYTENAKDSNGQYIKDEYGNNVLNKVYVAEGVELFKLEESTDTAVYYVDEDGNYSVIAKGGDVDITLVEEGTTVTDFECNVEIPAEAQEWLSAADTHITGEEQLLLTVAENKGTDERSAVVRLLDTEGNEIRTINLTQSGVVENTKYCKVRGNVGTTFLPMKYMDNTGGLLRYATFSIRRTDTGEMRVMNITQNK